MQRLEMLDEIVLGRAAFAADKAAICPLNVLLLVDRRQLTDPRRVAGVFVHGDMRCVVIPRRAHFLAFGTRPFRLFARDEFTVFVSLLVHFNVMRLVLVHVMEQFAAFGIGTAHRENEAIVEESVDDCLLLQVLLFHLEIVVKC